MSLLHSRLKQCLLPFILYLTKVPFHSTMFFAIHELYLVLLCTDWSLLQEPQEGEVVNHVAFNLHKPRPKPGDWRISWKAIHLLYFCHSFLAFLAEVWVFLLRLTSENFPLASSSAKTADLPCLFFVVPFLSRSVQLTSIALTSTKLFQTWSSH